jgi:hypothetical protein
MEDLADAATCDADTDASNSPMAELRLPQRIAGNAPSRPRIRWTSDPDILERVLAGLLNMPEDLTGNHPVGSAAAAEA